MVSFNIATIPSRLSQLIKTIDSIYNQVDVIRIALNGYSEKPKELDKYSEKLSYSITDNSLGDAFKFLWVEKSNGYYISGDDDIIYPSTYIEDMIKEIDKFGIVTHHGRSFESFPIETYYERPFKKVRCLSENLNYDIIQFGGTGVMGFHTSHFKPKFDIFKRANMADIWIGIEAHKQGLTITTLPHSNNYFTYQHVENTIWHEKNNNCEVETEIINKYFGKTSAD